MRILVIGATGYIASRAIPALLDAGHEVVAGARNPLSLDRFWWSERVERAALDVTDDDAVAAVITPEVEGILYLVHGMDGRDFRVVDLRAAERVRRAADAAGVRRIVYISGIIPGVAENRLSEHLISRLEVERELSRSRADVLTLRAAMVLGAGSTSFELMAGLASRLPVTVIPEWMDSLVEPIAVSDLARAIAGAFWPAAGTGRIDVGGGERLPYPELIARFARAKGIERPQVPGGPLPTVLVSTVAGWISDLPAPTVHALMESLREDMVARDDAWRSRLLGPDAEDLLGLDEALARSLAAPDGLVLPADRDPLGVMPGDPGYAGG